MPIDYHDDCYRKLLDSIGSAEQQKLADIIEIYDREGNRLYSNSTVNGEWKHAPKARAVVEKERNRKLKVEEQQQYTESWHQVFEYLDMRHASSDEVSSLRALADKFIGELKK